MKERIKLVHTKILIRISLSLFLYCLVLNIFAQQVTIDYSTYMGGSDIDDVKFAEVLNGETYIITQSHSDDFSPITNGSTLTGDVMMVITKFDADNNVVYSTYLGGGEDEVRDVVLDGDNLYILSTDYASKNFPVTDGSSLEGTSDVVFTRLNANTGEIEFATYIGSSTSDDGVAMEIIDDSVYFVGLTNSNNFPVTNEIEGYTFDFLNLDIFLMKMDTNANVVYSTYVGPYSFFNTGSIDLHIENGEAYVVAATDDSKFPVTDESVFIWPGALTITKFDNTGNVVYSTYLLSGNSTLSSFMSSDLIDGKLSILYNETSAVSNEHLITDGSTYVNGVSNRIWTIVDANTAQVEFASYFQFNDIRQVYYNEETWIFGAVGDNTLRVYKYDSDHNQLLAAIFPGTNIGDVHINKNGVYVLSSSNVATLPTTNGSTLTAPDNDLVFTKLNHDAQVQTLVYLGGDGTEITEALFVDSSYAYLIGGKVYNESGGNSYPTTNNTSMSLNRDVVYTKIELCPAFPTMFTDTLSPSKQMVCKNGLVDQIKAPPIFIDGSTFPTLYTEGSPSIQNDVEAHYQWQESENSTGPWVNIAGANQKNYTPQPVVADRYFRRISLQNECCSGDTISISNVDSILVNTLTAPMVDGGGIYNTCPNVSVSLDATVSGGLMPYQYGWDMGLAAVEDPTVSITESTVFTLLVTDANGCRQLDQALVNVYSADAGGDKTGACAGDSILIGGTPIAGLAGVTYAWMPSTNLGCTDCAQPNANPASAQTYEVVLTVPVTGGGTCQTTDSIKVIPITAPTVADFAGPDITICRGQTGSLGTSIEYFPLEIQRVNQSSISDSLEGTIANITDDNYITGARTNSETSPWIVFDLGQVYDAIAQIEIAAINSSNLAGSTRHFQVSTDSTNWEDVVDGFTGVTNNSLTSYTFESVDARYLRIYDTGTGQLDVSELRVYQTYNYTWSPGNYLPNNEQGEATFQPGNLAFPTPNPFLYYLTAEREGCTFVDDVLAHVIEARADVDGCGPRTVGEPDRTPNIDETYEWVKISGPGNFTGPTDQLITTVSASVGADTEYELRVSHGGTTCTDRVIVPPTCGCVVEISVAAPNGCPSFDLNAGQPVVLTATGSTAGSIDPSSFVYTWSVVSGPSGGLSSFSGSSVMLTDTIQRTYRVTFTSSENSTFSCTEDIEVNNPAWSLPVFNAPDVAVCADIPVQIGAPSVAEYSYLWEPDDGSLDQINISDPMATVNKESEFLVTVTENLSGCFVRDTVTVSVLSVAANAGEDIIICDNGTVTLGKNPAEPNTTYTWSPSNANWQNGTDENDAQPDVLVAINQEFTLEVFNSIGNCTTRDTVMVTVGTPVSPFSLPDVSYCPTSGVVTLGDAVPTGFESYSWKPTSLLVNPTVRTPNTSFPAPSSATTFTVLVRNSSGCELEAMQTIVPSVESPIAGSNKVICLGDNTTIGSSSNTMGAGITYEWLGAGTGDLSSTTSPNPTFTPSAAGTFEFILVKTQDGCSNIAYVDVAVNSFELPVISSITICQNATAQIGTTPEVGVEYLWSPTTNLSDPTIANPIVSGLTTSATYTLTATGLNGCTSSTDVLVGVNEVPAPTIIANDTVVCFGASHVMFNPIITPTANYNYIWSPNDGSIVDIYDPQSQINVFGVGTKTYTLQATNADNGCSSSIDLDLVVTNGCDWGDLPDISNGLAQSDYQTYQANNGPVHVIVPGLKLGESVDGEFDGQPATDALGDGADENGITVFASMDFVPGGIIRFPFDYVNTTGDTAHLEVWIDWDADGELDEATEIVFDGNDGNGNTPFPTYLEIDIPADAVTGVFLGMRLRLSNQDNMTPYGKALSGEVEDYLIGIGCAEQVCLPFESIILRGR